MGIKARDYQAEAARSLYAYFGVKAGNPVIAMPTGTGKSVVIAVFLQSVFQQYPTERVMVLTHVKELIAQNYAKLLDVWPTAPAGIYSSGLNRRDTLQKIIFGGIASVRSKPEAFGKVSLVLIDECHLVSPNDETMYRAFIDKLKQVNPYLKVIGFTATAWRMGHGMLTEGGGLFTDVCFDLTTVAAFNWLLSEGYLCPLIPKSTTAKLDLDGVHMRGGEFVSSELQKAVDKYEVTHAALQETLHLAGERKSWLVFCAGVEHANHVAGMLTDMGVPCEAVHSKMPDTERDRIIADFKSGKLRAVANNNVLTTGFDHPEIDLIVMLRPTGSVVLWVQMLGRGTRPVYALGHDLSTTEGRRAAIAQGPKQDCLVLDFAGNTPRLGPINDPVLPRRKGEASGDAPVKLCPACSTYNHTRATHCVFCGSEFPQYGPKLNASAGTADLIKIDVPKVQVFDVDHLTYAKHYKVGRPPSLRVTYYCGLRSFQEYVPVEHTDPFSQRKSKRWFEERSSGLPGAPPWPVQLDTVLSLAPALNVPTHVRVWTNKKPYPEVMAFDFTGTAFGTQQDTGRRPDNDVQPDSNMALDSKPVPQAKSSKASFDDFDDDIPF